MQRGDGTMVCPMCDRGDDVEHLPLRTNVLVFACDRCTTGVLRTFAAHEEPEPS